ncbi:MAG: tetraacyldisaccharide 4'-kinase [Pyrinomonadaceae bacterium]
MLSLLASIYGKVADARNRLYDRGVFDTFDLGVRTISIGNITAGGTGKTPLVAYVAEILAERGQNVCILTRGYGRSNPKQRVLVSDGKTIFVDAMEAGDEPFELGHKLLGKAIVIADANRVTAAEWAKRKFGVTVFVLDDGFQHRKARRDIDIVCIDATNPFGGGKMLPMGRLREPLYNLKRAEIIVITRANLVEDISDLRFQISKMSPDAKVFTGSNKVCRIATVEEFPSKTQRPQTERSAGNVFAFCGIGNPENFFDQLRQESFELTGSQAFRDHHIYSQSDISNIEKLAHDSGAKTLLTTAKDAVKLSDLKFEIPCYVVEVKTTLDDAERFAGML